MSISKSSAAGERRGGRMARRVAALALAAAFAAGTAYAAAPPINLAQTPLTVTIPAHPQVIIAIGNSQSMDGTLDGAIMTGAGSLGWADSLLENSSSPADYTVPTGFTPPINAGTGGMAPNTVPCPSNPNELCDNSASRLNVAKGAIFSVVQSFIADTDFSLMDYQTSDLGEYQTWLYAMSPDGGPFVFTNSETPGDNYITNPCYNYTSLPGWNPVYRDCDNIASSGQVAISGGPDLAGSKYMQVGSTSDDPAINDVLYAAGGIDPVCLVYGGPNPNNPWPPNYTLGDYNSNPGNIREIYSNQVNWCATNTGPTNAGYVPYAPQTMYMARGFGFDAGRQSYHPPGWPGYWSPLVTFSQGNVGQTPTTSSINASLGYFAKYLAPETNSTWTSEIKASAEQSPLAGLLANALGYFQNANPPSSNGCAPKRYVILVTDGLPTKDLSGGSWPPPGSTAAAQYGETVVFNSDGSLSTAGTNAQAVLDAVSTLQTMAKDGIKTYVVGLGSGVTGSVASQVLTAMAMAGGTSTYFPATDPTSLVKDLSTILAQVQQATQSVSSSAVNSSGIHVGSLAFQAQFTTSDTHQDWTGNLSAFPINPSTGYVDTTSSAAQWSAQAQLDSLSWNSRLIATWDPVTRAGTPFEWTSGSPTSGIGTSTALGQALSTNPADSNGQDALDYLRGDRGLEQSNGGPYRTRTHVLGDIVDSAPLFVGPPSGASQGATYAAFERQYATRPAVIYVGADDGMLHAFDAKTGKERFAFIPHAVFPNLIRLTYPLYNENHLFFVDGSPGAWDVQFADGSWHTIVVSTEGAGGNSIFALDVTDPAGSTSEADLARNVLWEFTDSDLGYVFGTPSLATTNAGTFLFFGNGYDSAAGSPYVYALNPQTGAIVAKINLCSFDMSACNSSAPNGLSTVTLVNSAGGLSGVNMLYAGDLQGNVWRVDLSSIDPSKWKASLLFKAVDSSGNPQPITTAPVVSLNPDFPRLPGLMVYVGTGELLSTNDLSSTRVQSMYGLYDAMPNGSAITRSQLVQQTLSSTTVTTVNGNTVDARSVTSNKVPIPTQMGWYIDFSLSPGEAIVTEPVLVEGALVFTTNQPSGISCQGGFDSWLYAVDFRNGGLFPTPILDETESGTISTSQKPVAGLFLGNVYSSSPVVTTGSLGNGSANLDILVNESGSPTSGGAYASYGQNGNNGNGNGANTNDPILNVLGRGGGQSRTAWWEIR
jgi:type IV pilus assembly protein PilY1